MTEPGAVRVTVARVCPVCGGRGEWLGRNPSASAIQRLDLVPCSCDAGVVWEPVTCAGCRSWIPDADEHPDCRFCEVLLVPTQRSFACQRWEPRDP